MGFNVSAEWRDLMEGSLAGQAHGCRCSRRTPAKFRDGEEELRLERLNRQPTGCETILLPTGQPVRKSEVLGGTPAKGEITSRPSVQAGTVKMGDDFQEPKEVNRRVLL